MLWSAVESHESGQIWSASAISLHVRTGGGSGNKGSRQTANQVVHFGQTVAGRIVKQYIESNLTACMNGPA